MTAWLAAGGEEQVVDYLCPQVYWGYGYTLQSGSTRFAFENIVPAWLAYPRAGGVALYFGLGAYRVGAGDGGANPDSVCGWSTGDALARQVQDLRQSERGRLGAVPVRQSVRCRCTGAGRCRVCCPAGGHWQRNVKSGGKPHKKKSPGGLFLQYGTGQMSCTAPENAVYYICICSVQEQGGGIKTEEKRIAS